MGMKKRVAAVAVDSCTQCDALGGGELCDDCFDELPPVAIRKPSKVPYKQKG